MKHVFLFLALMFSVALYGQDPINEEEDVITDGYNPYAEPLPELPPIPCYVNGVAHVSEIRLADGRVLVAIRFVDPITPGTMIGDAFTGSAIQATHAGTHELLVVKSTATQTLRVHLNNECGQAQALYADLQSPYNPEQSVDQQTIDVSREMGELVNAFISKETPLWEVLRDDATVSTYEKLAFYQQYALDKMPLPINEELLHGDKNRLWGTVGPLFRVTTECKCTVLRYTPLHTPGKEGPFTTRSTIWQEEQIGNQEQKHNGPSGTRYWKVFRALGPGKWLSVHTEGYKTKKEVELWSEYDVSHSETKTALPGVSGEIAVNLVCMNGGQLPENCGCDKKGTMTYRYTAELSTKAIVHDGGSQKTWRKSAAQAQDMVTVVCYQGDSKQEVGLDRYTVLAAREARLTATCETPVNPNFWTTFAEFANASIDIFTDDDGRLYRWKYTYRKDTTSRDSIFWNTQKVPPGFDTIRVVTVTTVKADSTKEFYVASKSEIYKNFAEKTIKLLTTSYRDSTVCTEKTGFYQVPGFFNFTLKPNEPIRFVMFNYAKVRASGRRSWYSYAQIVSDYNMTVTISPGQTEGTGSRNCCAPWSSAYLVSQPFRTKNSVTSGRRDLFTFGGFSDIPALSNAEMGGGVSGTLERPADDAPHCTVKVEGRNNAVSGNVDAAYMEARIQQEGAEVWVYDIAGRALGTFKVLKDASNPLRSIREMILQQVAHPQVLFTRIAVGEELFTFKMLAHE